MAISTYAIGALVRISATFTVASVATDPTTVTGTIRTPDGTESALNIVKDSTGNYHADYATLAAGEHFYKMAGTGACVAALEGQFQVLASEL